MEQKIFRTHNSQLRILRSRGLKVKSRAKRILEKENYYNVINGYKDLFLETSAESETYQEGADFNEILALYEFDRELRFIFLKRLLKIENQIKSVVSYKFSEKYGHDNYLKLNNFIPHERHNSKLKRVMEVISIFQREISNQSGKHNAVTHYITEHGYVPLWVLVNVLTFGVISKFYGVLKLEDRHAIAKEFNLQENRMFSYLKLMSVFRNICAHDERLYNTKLAKIEILVGPVHVALGLPKNEFGKYIYGTSDVFALLICIKAFLPKSSRGEFKETLRQIDKELIKLKSKLRTVELADVLNEMGFPLNWKELVTT